ncbi:MAG TPA: FAD-binding oxidoreductase [Chromatiales bacterium]|nr:FAD-binding oxidoreductase [Chromatiales bacterium]
MPQTESGQTLLPYGQGRSYGDVCLNDGGMIVPTGALDHFIDFDPDTGIVSCEAGVTLAQLLDLVVPRGWFLPVTPGTRFVSLGGAIANDVHGKNHHVAGTFGCHVRQFELLRSDGSRLRCSPAENETWFQATIGGLGLTGLITWAELQLKPIRAPGIETESLRFANLDEFMSLSRESDATWEYTVAWLDCLARGAALGRGIFYRGRHDDDESSASAPAAGNRRKLRVPVDAPGFLLNRMTLGLFNTLYYHRQRQAPRREVVGYEPFFYPLDGIQEWNRLYGRKGFYQFQCVVPGPEADVMRELLDRIARSGQGSFLAVIKQLGDIPSPGMLSFPRPGITLALDFANKGSQTRHLLRELEDIVVDAGGAMYPAKDALMRPASFVAFYPQAETFRQYLDPAFSSSFWRRVTRGEAKAV